MLLKLAEIEVSVPTIRELSTTIGNELREELQHQALKHSQGGLEPEYAEPPNTVAVSTDGGRVMTRAVAGRGVHDQQWKETKNACLLTMSNSLSEQDPHPELPACFANKKYVEKLVREIHGGTTGTHETPENAVDSCDSQEEPDIQPLIELEEPSDSKSGKKCTWRPKKLVRTCVSSMASSEEFGPLVAAEAQRRGFYRAQNRAFLGDGQAWNWTLQQNHFPDFIAITDFVHPLGYVYQAAQCISPDDHWATYLELITDIWQGRVEDVLKQLRSWQAQHPVPPDASLPDQEPRMIVRQTVTYLHNNRERMNYPEYRKAGLPISTAMVESLIKEINYRVKGTEKFWNRPGGAEAILQVRAAALRDDDYLSNWILNRPGSYFYRRSTPKAGAAARASAA